MPRMPLSAAFLDRSEESGGTSGKRTLWVFGAGASAHLQFPMSWGFLRSTVTLLSSYFREPNELSLDIGLSAFAEQFKKQDGSEITKDEMLRLKEDAELAFDCISMWEYVKPDDRHDEVRLQHLRRELGELRHRLADAEIQLPTAELLDIPPENLIQNIRDVDPNHVYSTSPRGRDVDRIEMDLAAAQECVRRIYFYALSEFNERSRQLAESDIDTSCYDQLVRAFTFERDSRVISFNYDTMLDESLFRRCTSSWAYDGISVAGINGYPVSPGEDADMKYIKPHGSLNMLYCGNCQAMHIHWFARSVPRGPGSLASENRRCTRCKSPQPRRTELMQGLLVPPLYDKEVIDGSCDAIVRAFEWANNIVAVGFSFPEQDAYFLDCMNTGLSANGSPEITLSLVLRGQSGTKDLKDRLLGRLPILTEPRFTVNATALEGFEAI